MFKLQFNRGDGHGHGRRDAVRETQERKGKELYNKRWCNSTNKKYEYEYLNSESNVMSMSMSTAAEQNKPTCILYKVFLLQIL